MYNQNIFQFRNKTGEGTITLYNVMPGIMLGYNDFHLEYYDSKYSPEGNVFCIDYCREGRLEYPAKDNAYAYVEAGDMKMDRRLTHQERFVLPLSHYHGVMITFDLNVAQNTLEKEFEGISINLSELQKKFCSDIYPMVIHGAQGIEHIFEELYQVPEKIKFQYFKIKVLELLLCLGALEISENVEEKPYFYKTQIEKIKDIHLFLKEHMEDNYTQEELSERFDMPLTTMKQCFKSVYGMTIGNWLKEYRMNQAAVLLKNKRDITVAEIAGLVGYDSPSKFAIAFRKVMGISPTEYRNRKH